MRGSAAHAPLSHTSRTPTPRAAPGKLSRIQPHPRGHERMDPSQQPCSPHTGGISLDSLLHQPLAPSHREAGGEVRPSPLGGCRRMQASYETILVDASAAQLSKTPGSDLTGLVSNYVYNVSSRRSHRHKNSQNYPKGVLTSRIPSPIMGAQVVKRPFARAGRARS